MILPLLGLMYGVMLGLFLAVYFDWVDQRRSQPEGLRRETADRLRTWLSDPTQVAQERNREWMDAKVRAVRRSRNAIISFVALLAGFAILIWLILGWTHVVSAVVAACLWRGLSSFWLVLNRDEAAEGGEEVAGVGER